MSESFIESLARPNPIPGGGAAAAFGASVGLALLEKIVRVEHGRHPASPESRIFWRGLLAAVRRSAEVLLRLRDEDGSAYLALAAVKTMPGGSELLEVALQQATDCPIKIMQEAQRIMDYVALASRHSKKHLLSDLLVVCELAHAAVKGCYHIACANLRLMQGSSQRETREKALEEAYSQSNDLAQQVRDTASSRF